MFRIYELADGIDNSLVAYQYRSRTAGIENHSVIDQT